MKKLLICLLSIFVCNFGFSQSADIVTEIIDAPVATYGQVCYLSACDRGLIQDDATYEDAVKTLFEMGEIPESVKADDTINYERVAFYFSKLWKINGGFFFRVTKGSSRYAFRQLRLDGVIPKYIDPNRIPSGADVLNMYTLGDATYNKGGAE
ncbi:MAG: hypothetical protein UHP28_00670 [Treponema sp.]|nr:hypothetical protein [Treponema sp.]